MSRQVTLSADVIARQRRAADPHSSVWVSAHAGSGKTHVLTERVLRLLLSGTPPEQILCLTYTKAAAAEMRKRVSARLGAWALMADADLAAAVATTDGAAPDADRLRRARTLFAHALETPGGLKIMTIHAFCESVLHRFPREAGVPFDFSVLDDNERARIVLGAREAVLAGGLRGDGAAEAVATLFGLLSDSQIADAIDAALGAQPLLRQVLARQAAAKQALRQLHGFGGGALREGVRAEMAAGYPLSAADHAALGARLPPGHRLVEALRVLDPARPDPALLCDAFLTREGKARAKLLARADADALPDLAARLAEEAARLEGLAQRLVAAELIERSEALLDVLAAITHSYEAEKRSRSLVDFDDLIEALRRLLAAPGSGPWVRYKLDSGITHVLVDESQDTNFQQWQVVRALTDDFFDGATAAGRRRTIFAVGDKKQSIYSFQGADPTLFVDQGAEYGMLVQTARLTFDSVPLKTSFRTLPRILEAVDLTFARADLRRGILSEDGYEPHDSARLHQGGLVTLWPPIAEAGEATDPDAWPTAVPPPAPSAARQVAERIAGEIRHWIDSGRPLAARGRAIVPGDVLVLVQTRGALFHEVIRALLRAGLPTPGADRLAVTSHIAVRDLMALGDVLLTPADDLQLATLLRSPLFDVSEDELFAIAQPRAAGETLWAALAASPLASARAAYDRLKGWRDRADFERPFEFFAGVLYAAGGLRRFHARLGAEVDDVLAAFLDLALDSERGPQPSLLGFLVGLRDSAISIKRELAEAGEGVRVMTVHGAKGLEAPIVILADAASTSAGKTGKPVHMRGGPTPLFIHAGARQAHTPASLALSDDDAANLADEYWRKLYVAMTRAEDELYVTGALTRTGTLEGSWYEAVAQALEAEAEARADGTLVYPRERTAAVAMAAPEARPAAARTAPELPELPAHRLRRIIRPSRLDERVSAAQALETDAEALAGRRDPAAARAEGIALHALLHHLARLDPALWSSVSDRALAVLLPEAPETHAALARKARALLTRPELEPLFGPGSRGEVPILAQGTRHGAPITIAGRIDRLVVGPQGVLIVDYKSDAAAPATADGVPAAYLTQLGLYALCATQLFPGRPVRAAILWTGLESLMNLEPERLAEKVAGFTIG